MYQGRADYPRKDHSKPPSCNTRRGELRSTIDCTDAKKKKVSFGCRSNCSHGADGVEHAGAAVVACEHLVSFDEYMRSPYT